MPTAYRTIDDYTLEKHLGKSLQPDASGFSGFLAIAVKLIDKALIPGQEISNWHFDNRLLGKSVLHLPGCKEVYNAAPVNLLAIEQILYKHQSF